MQRAASPTNASSARREVMRPAAETRRRQPMVVYTVDVHSIPGQPFARETFSLREDAERFVEEIRRDNPDLANDLRVEKRGLVSA